MFIRCCQRRAPQVGRFFPTALFLLFALGCARAPIQSPSESLRVSNPPKAFQSDDLNFKGLAEALQITIEKLKAPRIACNMSFGAYNIPCTVYAEHLEMLNTALLEDLSGQKFLDLLESQFQFLEVYGDPDWGDVFITSYYEPIIKGSKKRRRRLSQPLYKKPEDLLLVDMSSFAKTFPIFETFYRTTMLEKSRDGYLRGRVIKNAAGADVIQPYYSREEIDSGGVLKNRGLEIAWVDPVDAFFLQIQGSGVIEFENGERIILGYHEQNGFPYYAIGRALRDRIPLEKMSMQTITAELKKMSADRMKNILNMNSSYIFFQELEHRALTAFGVPAQAGRSIATDSRYFPKGALAFLSFELPAQEESANPDLPIKASDIPVESHHRYVLDHDVGGAIRGPGRVDLFWGSGPEAAAISGRVRNTGRLYYVIPKNMDGYLTTR